MSFEIINNPIFTTIQDKGRFGYSNLGVTNSGVMDEYAYIVANRLLNNPLDTNVLEITLSNLELIASIDTKISITGGNCDFFINDVKKEIWQTHSVKKGDILKISKIYEGNWVYLAVFGGFDIKKEFGSNSTTVKESLGGLDGNRLKKGDILPYKSCSYATKIAIKKEFIPKYEDELILRVIVSYQEKYFNLEEKKEIFFKHIYGYK